MSEVTACEAKEETIEQRVKGIMRLAEFTREQLAKLLAEQVVGLTAPDENIKKAFSEECEAPESPEKIHRIKGNLERTRKVLDGDCRRIINELKSKLGSL